MPTRHGIRVVVSLLGLVLGASSTGLDARRSCGDDRPGSPPNPAEERAIRELDAAFVRDYDKGDSKALAALFTEDAEVIEADGRRYRGRALAEEAFAATFAASPGSKIAIEIDSIRLIGTDVAKEEGRSVVTPAHGMPLARLYSVLYVKRDGSWLISSVREEEDPSVRPRDRLKELQWMVGDWVDEGLDSEVRVHCEWTEDENFLIRTFTVKRQGKPVLTVTQRVGWDPLARQIRSWEFDSEGGFGEGRWSRANGRWVVKHTATRPEGAAVSATNVLMMPRPDQIRWTSIDRAIGEESLPDDEGYTLVRVPPPPGSRHEASSNPKSTPNPSRDHR